MSHVSFHPGFNGWLLLLVAGIATALVAIFYRRAYRALSPGQWIRLYGLRMIAIGIVLLLLFRPVYSHQREIREKRGVTFLIDQSASMGIADDPSGGTRLEHAIDKVLQWSKDLERDFDTQYLGFADTVTPLEAADALVSVQTSGEATSLSRALDAPTKIKSARDLEAIFIISDGVHNSAGDPIAVAARLGVPIYSVGTGSASRDRSSYRDVRVTDIEAPDQMSVDNLARVKGYVDATGFPGRVVSVTLHEDDTQVAEQELVLDDIDGAQDVTFEFTPATKGLHRYTVKVPPVSGEKIAENNERSTSSLVIEARIRVLYVEGTLRSEYGVLVGRFLSKDPNVEFCALVQTKPNVFMQRSNIDDLEINSIPDDPEVLDTFDVFMIGDLDSTYLRGDQMELIRDRVRAGAGLIMMGGYHSLGPGGYADTPIEELLPVFVGDREVGQIDDPFQPQLTVEGRQHPIFANIAPFFPTGEALAEIEGLPPLDGSVRVRRAKPTATVLAVHPSESTSDDIAMPVVAVQPVGNGRAAIFTGDTTRNWQQTLRSLDRESPFLRFWGQMVRWLAGRSEEVATEAGIVATTDKSYYEPESTVAISAIVRGAEGEATSAARVVAKIQAPRNYRVEVELAPVTGPAGNYRAVFEPQQSGRYEIIVEATLDSRQTADQTLKADAVIVEIGRPNLEFDRLDLDEKMLTEIAIKSGGRYAHISTADRLIERLKRRQQSRQVQYEVRLYWPPLLWIAFVGVLTTEWILRRKASLR
ncbi:MAG: glutamine amidotransferase [Pirellulaceae bacterium]